MPHRRRQFRRLSRGALSCCKPNTAMKRSGGGRVQNNCPHSVGMAPVRRLSTGSGRSHQSLHRRFKFFSPRMFADSIETNVEYSDGSGAGTLPDQCRCCGRFTAPGRRGGHHIPILLSSRHTKFDHICRNCSDASQRRETGTDPRHQATASTAPFGLAQTGAISSCDGQLRSNNEWSTGGTTSG
jgi:hypothetical protein